MEYINWCVEHINHEMDELAMQTTQMLTCIRLGRNRADPQPNAQVEWFADNIMKLTKEQDRKTSGTFDANLGEKYWNSLCDMMQPLTQQWTSEWLLSVDTKTRWDGVASAATNSLLDVTELLTERRESKGANRGCVLRFEESIHFGKDGQCELIYFMYEKDERHNTVFFQSAQESLKHAKHVTKNFHNISVYDYNRFLQLYHTQEHTLENPYSPNVVKKLQDLQLGWIAEHHIQASLATPDSIDRCMSQTSMFRVKNSRFLWIVGSCWFVVLSQCSHRVPATNRPANYGFDTWEADLYHVSPDYYLYNVDNMLFSVLSRFLHEYHEAVRSAACLDNPLGHPLLRKIMWWKYNKMSHSRFATGPRSSLRIKTLTAASLDSLTRQSGMYDMLRQRCQYLFSNLPFDVNRSDFRRIVDTNQNPLEPSHKKMLFSTKPDGVLVAAALIAGQDIVLMTRSFSVMRVHNSAAQCQRIRQLLANRYPHMTARGPSASERVFVLEGELVEASFRDCEQLYHVTHYSHVPALVVFSVSYFVSREESNVADKNLLYFLRYAPVGGAFLHSALSKGHAEVPDVDQMCGLMDDVMTNDNRLYNMCGCTSHERTDVFCLRPLLQEHEQSGVKVASSLRVVQNTPLLMFHKTLFESFGDFRDFYEGAQQQQPNSYVEDLFPGDSAFAVPMDGFIVSPRLSRFCAQQSQQDVWLPVNEEQRRIYKWKPLEKRTIDFECRVSPCGQWLQLWAMESDLVMMRGNNEEPMLNMQRHTRKQQVHKLAWDELEFGPGFCERYLVTKSVRDYFAGTTEIHEFSFSPVREKWSVVGVRRDKKQPNNLVVVFFILTRLLSTLSLDEMAQLEQCATQTYDLCTRLLAATNK